MRRLTLLEFLIKFIKPLLPPLFLDLLKSMKPRTFVGPYQNWQAAKRDAQCDYSALLEEVKNCSLKVKNGEADCVVDSVSLRDPEYNWPLLAMLLKAANENGGSLCVLDYGGSLGTVYFQNREFLDLKNLQWRVVEQPSFVEVGKETFQNEELTFHASVSELSADGGFDFVLVSGVLQLLETPYEVLKELLDQSAKYVVVDRTPFLLTHADDLLTVQKLPRHMFSASFPHWFLSKQKLLKLFRDSGYMLISEFEAYHCLPADIRDSRYCGFAFERTIDPDCSK